MTAKSRIEINKELPNRMGIYIHIPFCSRKCIYCDFYSVGCRNADWKRYGDVLFREMQCRRDEVAGKKEFTLYIGGGTPSLMPAGVLESTLERIRDVVETENGNVEYIETTIEVNPDDVTLDKARSWRGCGIDRISMGVQSLNDNELRFIGRRHDAKTALNAYGILRQCFDNVSLDMMFGLPGQTLASLSETLDGFLHMKPEHISAYSLTYEERTALTRMRDSGKISEADENLSVGMFRMVNECLRGAGYFRYEISNYSLPGYESRHNSSYWKGIPYIGLGPSAHSYDGRCDRRWNIPDLDVYLTGVENSKCYHDKELLTQDELKEEFIMTGLRVAEGIDLDLFASRFGEDARNMIVRKAGGGLQSELCEIKDGFLRLTDNGVMLSDEIIVDLF